MKTLEIKSLQEIDELVKKSGHSANIPRYIFQTWRTHEVSIQVFDRVRKMQQDNPDWHYCFFTDAMCREFIEKHFDAEVLAAYDNLIPGAYKADLWRYCVLYHYGGMYMDIKMTALVTLDDIIKNQSAFMVARDIENTSRAGDFYCYNAFMCGQKKHPIFKLAIEMVVRNVKNGYYGTDQLLPTGPGLLGLAVNTFLNKPPESTLLPRTYSSEKDGHIEILPIINVQQNIIEDDSGKNIISLGYGKVQSSLNKVDLKGYQFLKTEYQTGFMHYHLYKSLKKIKRTHQAHYSILWMKGSIYHNQHKNQEIKYLKKQFRSFRWYYYNCVVGDILKRCYLRLTRPFQSINTDK